MGSKKGMVINVATMAYEKDVPKGCVECPFCGDVVRGDKFTEHALMCEELKASVEFEDHALAFA